MTNNCYRNRRPCDIERNLEDVTLIWCDSNIDDSMESQYMQALLRKSNNYVQFYTDPQLCLEFIRSIKDEKIFLIISDIFQKQIVSEVCSLPTVSFIFLFCTDCQNYTPISIPNQYHKTIQIFTNKQELMKSIRSRINLVKKQTMEFSLFDGQRQKSTRNLSKESASFLGFQILFTILRKIPRTDQALHDMLEKCSEYYRLNDAELRKIEQFRMTYTMDKAVEWYTADSFLYRLVNKVLRTEDIDLLYLFRCYIVDLCSQLEQEHKKLLSTQILTLYRGQEMPTEELEKLKESVGISISPNGFFSTSKELNVAITFIADCQDTDEKKIVLFEITADPRLESVIFADIETYSSMQEEKEVLFSLGATFIITQVEYDTSINIWKVYITATDEGSKQAKEYLNYIQKQMEEEYSPTILFGYLLWRDIGEVDKAEKYFKVLLKSLPDVHEDTPCIYHQLGNVFYEKHDWNMALDFYTKAYDLRCQRLPPDHLQIASSLNGIGISYECKENFDQALDCLKQTFTIYQKNYSGDHLNIARTLTNTGIVLRQKKEYDKALDYSTKALEMYKRVLPEQHNLIARCLCNIGIIYEVQFNFARALEFYHQAYEMNEKVLSSEHIYLTIDLNRIVSTYNKNGEYEKAFNFCNMKLTEQQLNLPKNHPRIGHTLQTMGDIYSENDSAQAFAYYHEALTIFKRCAPQDQQATADCLEHISHLYYNRGIYDEALKYRKNALDIQQKYRSYQHPKTALSLQSIGKIYYSMKNYSQALDSFKRAAQIYEINYVPEYEKIKEIQQYIDEAGKKLNETSSSM